ncbi:hypothetical protein L2E68_22430 [Planktothrix agardhii 1029]|jgi:hypothetical protein|uniref:DUF4276 domain-containing protein n=1 Tax=Planktothrix agardhii (strain NIVA-CYA 126/8) TaxID=388467 RepID=A0A073CMW5_PLAA1|nr:MULTISPECIES: hypothetical protein [Planktothrix]KEI65295.1 hypothetical protein A19Y_9102 [Planktothrix agardhii NIVA-CYA 126/8]MCB8766638.1 hypothetical protein [Planktothrix agardhii 1809]MCB8780144.1 hypothetical protein [Planktothrix agardhii 1031]MCB8784511.1 hypothetical protein [Planktothrix agardhii 1808]MCF3568839.1 hypothetical protein [Planktothrix agardhii 1807]
MNIYFLVEGKSTEKKIYPKWLEYLIPNLVRVQYYDQVENNNYYLISGQGYPRILYDGLENAVDKILEAPRYDYLVICVDADEESVEERIQYIREFIRGKEINLGKTKVEIIVQNRCIETWLLGNKRIFDSRQPLDLPLASYVNYYDVSQNNPEEMGKDKMRNHADFHYEYLREVFRSKNSTYSKKNPKDAKEKYYFEELQKRVRDQPEDLKTFQFFLEFCERIKNIMIQRAKEE